MRKQVYNDIIGLGIGSGIILFCIGIGVLMHCSTHKDEYEEKRMTDIAAECRSLAMQKDFVAAHEKLGILASDAEKVPSDYSHREFKIKRYEDTFNYVFNEEALYLCSIGDNASIDRLTFFLASIPIKGVAITEGTEYKYESDFEISVREEHQQYINSTNSFNQKCDKLVDLGIAHHNYAIISRVLPLYKNVPDVLSDKYGDDGWGVIHKISFSDISKQNAKKKVNKAIKDGVFPNITIEVH